MITLISKWKLRDGCAPELIDALKIAAAAVEENEPGTLMYTVHTRASAPLDADNRPIHPIPLIRLRNQSEIVFFEIYENAEAFETHINGAAFQAFKNENLRFFCTQPDNPEWPMAETVFLDGQAGFIGPANGCSEKQATDGS